MKKLTKDEAANTLTLNNGRETALRAALRQLAPGEALVVLRTEWKAKHAPSRIARELEKSKHLKFEAGLLLDKSGWKIERVS